MLGQLDYKGTITVMRGKKVKSYFASAEEVMGVQNKLMTARNEGKYVDSRYS